MNDKIQEMKNRLCTLKDPITSKFLNEKNFTHVGYDKEKDIATLIVKIEKCSEDVKRQFQISVTKLIKIDLGIKGLKIEIEFTNTPAEETHSQIKYIGIASGKGGVGKSTVTANIAMTLTRLGKKVGIIDADIYGFSIPKIFNIEKAELMTDENEKIFPINVNGIEIISTQFFLPDINKPIMWRGPMLSKILNHFFNDILWSEDIEYILIDLPPGTGDVQIDVGKYVPKSQMIVVTTPHPNASFVAEKAGHGARELEHNVIGVVENMSFFVNPINDVKEFIFGQGGGDKVAKTLNVPLLGQIPIEQPKEKNSSIYELSSKVGFSYLTIAKSMLDILK